MPTGTRRQAQTQTQEVQIDAHGTNAAVVPSDAGDSGQVDQEMEDDDLVEEYEGSQGLKEISSLASWTVSTAKPGNGVAALRSPDTSLFWQSDGPQPHLLSIHYFKLVSIVHMRIYLDFENDESYTPTKIQFLAGMGIHDLQDFAEMSFEQPTGWIDVDFSNVGQVEGGNGENEDEERNDFGRDIDWSRRPVLRAFLVQIKILENHQNGKDTHLRAVQLFARDETFQTRKESSPAKPLLAVLPVRPGTRKPEKPAQKNNIKLASWMVEPDLR